MLILSVTFQTHLHCEIAGFDRLESMQFSLSQLNKTERHLFSQTNRQTGKPIQNGRCLDLPKNIAIRSLSAVRIMMATVLK